MKTQNFYLREIQASDIENVYRGLSDPEITAYYDVHYSSLKATQKQMDWYSKIRKEGTGIWWGIFGIEDNQFRGASGYYDMSKKDKRAEIGLWLLKEYWGQGILKEVMPAIFNYGFTELGLNRVEGYVLSTNKKCKAALSKINFTHEGMLREYEIKNGEYVDVDVFSILRKEWVIQ